MKSPTLTKSTCATQVEQQPRVDNVMTNMRGGELPDAPPKRVENTFPHHRLQTNNWGKQQSRCFEEDTKNSKHSNSAPNIVNIQ